MSLNTTPRTFVTSEIETAAIFNAELRDAITGIQAAWSTYVVSTTNITVGNGTVAGRSNRMGKTIDFTVVFTLGSSSAVAGAPTFSLPVTARSSDWASTDCTSLDTSAGSYYPFGAIATSTSVVTFRPWSSTAGNPFGTVGAASPFTWATGDIMSLAGRYEAA